MRLWSLWRRLEEASRPVHPTTRRVLDERWAALHRPGHWPVWLSTLIS